MSSQLVEERREARRRRILENSEKRMTTILGGGSGDGEKRADPGLEDGPIRSMPFTAGGTQPAANHTSNALGVPSEGKPIVTAESNVKRKMPTHRTWNDAADARHKPYEKPRLLFCMLIGLFSAVCCVWWELRENILLPFVFYEFTLEALFYYVKFHVSNTEWIRPRPAVLQAPRYPPHGHMVNVLLSFGFADQYVKFGGYVTETVCRVVEDCATMMASFFLMLFVLKAE